MSAEPIGHWRLRNLRLSGEPLGSAAEVVGWLGAVQAQDYGPAKWSVGQRGSGLTDPDVERAFNAGEILRTHALRPTWHFVTPADIRWLVHLTRPRVVAMSASSHRRDELDAHLFARAEAVIARALEDGQPLLRPEIGQRLASEGITAQGTRLAHILMHAELSGLICSGPLRGKQHTYVLLDRRVPPVPELSRDQALAELARRYFTSHGPASVRDFQWWSSLPRADVTRGLEGASSDLVHQEIDGITYWWGRTSAEPRPAASRVYLVQMFDEYLVGYSQTRRALDLASLSRQLFKTINVRAGVVVLDSQIVGTWRRTPDRGGAPHLSARFHAPLDPADLADVQAEVDRYAAFQLGAGARAELRVEAD